MPSALSPQLADQRHHTRDSRRQHSGQCDQGKQTGDEGFGLRVEGFQAQAEENERHHRDDHRPLEYFPGLGPLRRGNGRRD